MKNDIYQFHVDYHQIGSSEDLEDWIYTYTMKKILSDGHIPLKYVGSGSPKKDEQGEKNLKEIHDLINDFVAMIPNGKVAAISKSGYRLKMSYIISDVVNYLSYLQITHTKRDKVETIEFAFTTASPEVMVAFEGYVKDNFSNDKKSSVYVIAQSQGGGLQLHNLGPIESAFERGNYSEDIVRSYDYVIDQFNRKDPYGRLAIFNGPPGTGKTYLLRSLIGQIKDCLVVLLPSKLVGEIDSPALITLLAEEKAEYGTFNPDGSDKQSLPILFIIEDADACLVPRESDNVLTISSLLNYTDGILGSMLDLRVIATTNQERIEFDEALTRPGRLCRHVYIGELPPVQAAEVYKRLSNGKEKEYKKPVSLAQVYADVNGGFEDTNAPKNVLGFGANK